jgi:hypothetical protein
MLSLPTRIALGLALVVTPDDRIATRRRIMRGAVMVERDGRPPSAQQQRQLLGGHSGLQRTFIAFGIAMFVLARQRPVVLALFGLAFLWLCAKAAAAVATAVLAAV